MPCGKKKESALALPLEFVEKLHFNREGEGDSPGPQSTSSMALLYSNGSSLLSSPVSSHLASSRTRQ